MSIASVKTRKAASSFWHLWHFTPIPSDVELLDISENLRGNPRTTDPRPFDGELTAEPWLCPVEYDPQLRWVVSTERLLHRVSGISEHASPPVESLPFESLMVRVPHHDPEHGRRVRAVNLSRRWVKRRSCSGPFVVLGKPRTTDLRPWLWGASLAGSPVHSPRTIGVGI